MTSARTHEREIKGRVFECTPRGALNRHAVGWSRRPLHVCNLRGHWPRKKQWEYWCVTTREHLVAFTLADVDYAGLAVVTFLEYATWRLIERVAIVPLARGFAMPQTVRGGSMRARAMGLDLGIDELGDKTHLFASFTHRGEDVHVAVAIDRPPTHESVSVLVPWSARRFQYTSKHSALRARGMVTVGAKRFDFGPDNDAFACLDFGRGVWPYRTTWNWAAGSGVCDGRTIGLNFGGRWTDGTGVTENAIVVDGRAHKIGDDVDFEYDRRDFTKPWRIGSRSGARVDLVFTPSFERAVRLPLGLVSTELHWTLGRFDGTVASDDSERIAVRDLRGWAEEHRARW